jgi:glutathione peroxidase
MMNAHDFKFTSIDGKPRSVGEYKGKALLVVNVASECGYTPQYEGLEKLYARLKGKGLAILGVPCNQFGGQEPGTEKEIVAFCQKNYGVTFDLASKVDVNGPSAHPLYQWLTKDGGEPIKWNFAKFLVDKNGDVVQRFEHKVKPEDAAFVAAVEKTLG